LKLDECERQLGSVSKTVGLTMAQMLSAAAQQNEVYTAIAAKDTVNFLRIHSNSIRGIIACTPGQHDYHMSLVNATHNLLQKSVELIQEAAYALMNPTEAAQNQQQLTQIARNISQALYECVNCLPGQKDIDLAMKKIGERRARAHADNVDIPKPTNTKTITQIQTDLNNSAVQFNQTANDILYATRKSPQTLIQSADQFSNGFVDCFDNGLTLASQVEVSNERDRILCDLNEMSDCSLRLLNSVKSFLIDSQTPAVRNQLALAAKGVTDSINTLINISLSEANNSTAQNSPAQKQCDQALRDIESLRNTVQEACISQPIKDNMSYYECLEQIFEQSRILGESLNGLKASAETFNTGLFVKCVRDVSNAVRGLIEASMQSAYLIGASDIGSKTAKPAIFNAKEFSDLNKVLHDACAGLLTQSKSQQQLIQFATLIAHAAASLCNGARNASTKTGNPLAKRHFVQSAKQVANATASLVKKVKTLENGPFGQHAYNELVVPLLDSADNLCQYAQSTEFQSVAAVLSPHGIKAQEPILTSNKSILDATIIVIQASKYLSANNKEPQHWQKFATNSKLMSESIKRVATLIKERAPAKHECDKALQTIENCLRCIENATISSLNQCLMPPIKDKSLQSYQEQAINSAMQMAGLVVQLRNAAKFEAEKLGHTVTDMAVYFEPLVLNVIGCASKTNDSQQQIVFLEQTKTILESTSQLIVASKECGGNAKNQSCHQAIDENSDGTKEALDDLIQTLDDDTVQHGNVSTMVDNMSRAIAMVDDNDDDDQDAGGVNQHGDDHDDDSVAFIDHQTKTVQLTKVLQRLAQDMAVVRITELGVIASELTQTFNALMASTKQAILNCSVRELENRLKASVHELGNACIDLVRCAGQYHNRAADKILKKELIEKIDVCKRKASRLLHTFETISKGTQACINASAAVAGIVADLDTIIL
jgi:talin